MERQFPRLFTPIKIKNTFFRNRILSAPNSMQEIDHGIPNDNYIAYLEEKARGGAAQVTVGEVSVGESGAHLKHIDININSMTALANLAGAIKERGAVASAEFNHAGDAGVPLYNNGNDPVSSTGYVREDGIEVREMTEEMMDKVANDFADAAAHFQIAGFDMCMVHAGHHWLLNQFLSPLWNKRTDKYGGSFENRIRFPMMVVKRVRERVGLDFLIELRISASDLTKGGKDVDESIEFIKLLEDSIDMVHVSAGAHWETATFVQSTSYEDHGRIVYLAEKIKKSGIKLPIVAMGGIVDPEMAEDIIVSGKADFVAMARAIIADPEFPNKAKTGCSDEIVPCIRCMNCLGSLLTNQRLTCTVNPKAGKELRIRSISSPKTLKKIMVAGGGPGGMQAAITAAERGHDVTLFEKDGALGGILKFTDTDTIKADLRRYKNYLVKRVEDLNIEVQLNTEVNTKKFVEMYGPDSLIIAVGSEPIVPEIPGIDRVNVMHAIDVYKESSKVGENVVIIGGGLVGCEVGMHLGRLGKKVSIIEITDELARGIGMLHMIPMQNLMKELEIDCLTKTKCIEITDTGVTIKDAEDKERLLEADTIVYAVGMKPKEEIFNELRDAAMDVVPVGDCLKVGKVKEAVHAGYFAILNLE